jgi:hypothetical protein
MRLLVGTPFAYEESRAEQAMSDGTDKEGTS